MISYFIEQLGGYIDPVAGWLADGGLVLILATFFTAWQTKNKREKWKLQGKEEDMESLIFTVLNLKNVVMGMFDIFVLVFSTSKGVTEEVQKEMFARLDVIKKEYGAKIDKDILETIALIKVKKKEASTKAKEMIENTKGEAQSMIDSLAAKANEIVSKELNKD